MRATWKSGEAARRSKFMARKAKEARQLTMEGLKPEMQRLEERQRKVLQGIADALAKTTAEIQGRSGSTSSPSELELRLPSASDLQTSPSDL